MAVPCRLQPSLLWLQVRPGCAARTVRAGGRTSGDREWTSDRCCLAL